jgi:glutamate dehydrogenase/leucine dehydrogenase
MAADATLMSLPPQDFVAFCRAEGIRRFSLVPDTRTGRVMSSHSQLQPLADFVGSDTRDFMQHEGLFFQVTQEHDTLQGAFVHRTRRGQAAGGVRYWDYDSVEEYLRDGLRLAKGMTRKNALAGLWWGGGKGVMARNPRVESGDLDTRTYLYREYGRFISTLRGCYVTAEDVGTSVKDMADVFSYTRFTTCIPGDFGGSGNPSVPTARGVVSGMEAALDFLERGDLAGKTVAVQGMGNVGGPLIGFLFEKDVGKIIACDIDPEIVGNVVDRHRGRALEARAVERGDLSIFSETCDILSPNATGAVLNPRTIPKIRARVVCGAANNQLEDAQRDDRLLFERDIRYVPDFLTNRMGIVNAANEQYGYVKDDPLFERHLTRDWEHSIYRTTRRVLHKSCSTSTPSAEIAMHLADRLSLEEHPIFGHRGRQIIASLVADRWHES